MSQYQGINPDVWEMMTDAQREYARRIAAENWAKRFRPAPCKCQDRPGCECPCHRSLSNCPVQEEMPPGQANGPQNLPARESAMFCDHANEVPMTCPCAPDCYCKDHTCRYREAS